MFRIPIALAVGVTAALSAAHADILIIQGTPTLDPAIVIDGEVADLPRLPGIDPDTLPEEIGTAGPDTVVPGNILDNPAFHRLAEMCDTLGLACDGPLDHAGAVLPPAVLSPDIEDEAKRIAELIADRDAFADAMEEHFEMRPAPHLLPIPRPRMLFGWDMPSGGPDIAPPLHPLVHPPIRPLVRPHVTPQFGTLVPPRPRLIVPRITPPHVAAPTAALIRPGAHDLSGFYHRLNTPAVIPRGMGPRGVFPWHRF